MNAGLRTLLTEIVDYAGLFPPAQLPLEVAVSNYSAYADQPEAWMLGRFICPAAQLRQAAALFSPRSSPVRVSALGTGGATAAEFLEAVRRDLGTIQDAEQVGPIRVEAYEVRLPPNLMKDPCTADLVRLCEALQGAMRDAGRGQTSVSLEAPAAGPQGPAPAINTVSGISFYRLKAGVEAGAQQGNGRAATQIGFKLRCGGVSHDAFPSAEAVAQVIAQCRDGDVPLKFTAGLHHPFPVFDDGLRTQMHGFLNVFLAGVLARSADLSVHDLQGVLEEKDARQFSFGEEDVGWNDARATLADVRLARQHSVLSFGSCSFDEPRDDLRAMRLLPEAR